MKRFSLVLLLLIGSTLFAAYPDEYPPYLRMLGFTKKEIQGLGDGGIIVHSLRDARPGEQGISAAKVFDVPGYFIRDYYSYIENFRSLENFQIVGKFSIPPTLQDLEPLTFDAVDLQELSLCKTKCSLNLTQEEIAGIQQTTDVQEYYRNILLDRLLAYQGPANHSQNYLQDFPYLPAYFPNVVQYLAKYPATRDKKIPEFFFWVKEKIGGKNVIQLRHVYTQRVSDDFVLVNHLVYSSQFLMASASVVHLINYVDRGYPRTLLVYHGRNYVDPEIGTPSKQDKRIFSALEIAGEELEKRYLSSAYPDFPYGLRPTDQR